MEKPINVQSIVIDPGDELEPGSGTCEAHDDREAVAVVGGAQVCAECYNADDVKCPKCGHREFGKFQDHYGQIGCPVCFHVWTPTERE